MHAVNLIPADARSGGASRPTKSGGAVYVLLGGLAALAVMVGLWAMSGSRMSDDKAELGRLQAEAARAKAQTAHVASIETIRTLRTQRSETVKALAAARIDWAPTLDAVARTLPADTWLESMTASASPGSGPAGGAGGGGAVASSAAGPSLQITGCSPSQARVARLMPRLRTIPDVAQVTLVGATAADESAGTTSEGCAQVSFEMVLIFASTAPAAAPAPGATPASGTPATAPVPDPGTAGTPAAAPAGTPAPATTPASASQTRPGSGG